MNSESDSISRVKKLQRVWERDSALTLKLFQITQDRDQSNSNKNLFKQSNLHSAVSSFRPDVRK